VGTVVFYIDESGSTDTYRIPIESGRTPLFTLSSVAIELTQWREVDRLFNSLKERFFPDILARKLRREEIEVKGNDLASPRNKDSQRRHQFLLRVFRLLKDFNVRLFSVTFIKSTIHPISATSLYTHGFQILLERFHHYIENNYHHESGIMICDSRAGAIKGKGLDKEVAKSFQSFIFGNPLGRTLTTIHEAPLFADSQITVGIQLADIASSCIYANHYYYYVRNLDGAIDYQHMQKYWPLLDELQYKPPSLVEQNRMYGYRVLDHTKTDKEPRE
jgi:hypothetical protein